MPAAARVIPQLRQKPSASWPLWSSLPEGRRSSSSRPPSTTCRPPAPRGRRTEARYRQSRSGLPPATSAAQRRAGQQAVSRARASSRLSSATPRPPHRNAMSLSAPLAASISSRDALRPTPILRHWRYAGRRPLVSGIGQSKTGLRVWQWDVPPFPVQTWTGASTPRSVARPREGNARFGSTTENAPAWGPGRFWGYYREERYVSLYMWIRGR
jgi:hypothetical protein